jgi:hypothetical protein
MWLTRRPEEICAAEDETDWEEWVAFLCQTRAPDRRRKGLVERRCCFPLSSSTTTLKRNGANERRDCTASNSSIRWVRRVSPKRGFGK